jgi:hypothetical protein
MSVDYVEAVAKKWELIQEHRREQERDINQRHAQRRKLVAKLNVLQRQLARLEGISAADIADRIEERSDLKLALAQEIEDDRVAEEHWARHFALPEFSLSCDEQAALRQKRLHPSDFAESLSKSTKVRGPRLVAGSGMTPLKKLAADEPQASTEGVKETSAESPDNAALVKFLNRSALMEMGKKNFPRQRSCLRRHCAQSHPNLF